MRHECRSPYVKTFWRSAVVGKFLTETHLLLLQLQPILSHKTTVFHAAASTGWNRRIFLLKLFNLSTPLLKIVKTYVGPYRSCKSNRKIGTSIEV